MRVYTLTVEVGSLGSSFLGVFKTTKKAMKAAEEFAKNNPHYDGFTIYYSSLNEVLSGFYRDNVHVQLSSTGKIKKIHI
jgi:hypothetical protein